ncbi:MAG: flagellar hook-basal body complex protein FliE [Phycisphaerae bacterium]|nr:flagellar hook-basal body complex protein FliE [Phycisphaerae bacterium]
MTDPLGLIGAQNGVGGAPASGGSRPPISGPSFAQTLRSSIEEVNRAQQDATRAVEDLATGDRSDIEGVVLATQKADNAFRMLQALRNRVVEAYDELKQMRV